MLCFGFLSACPIHLHFLLFNSSSTGGWLIFCQSSFLEIFSDHLMLRIHLRNLLMKTWSLCRRPLVVFQVSAPYKRMVFTLELNNQTLGFNEIFLAFQIDPIILNAVLAFPILILTSLSDPLRCLLRFQGK